MQRPNAIRLFAILLSIPVASSILFGTTTHHKRRHRRRHVVAAKSAKVSTQHVAVVHHHAAYRHTRRRHVYSPWDVPTFADSASNDFTDGDDLTVRRAAVDALGPYNGSVVVVDPSDGRVLTMVNQKLALQSGFQPCSTIKIVAALAGLSEGLIDDNTLIRIYGRTRIGLTQALAHSNNFYFATVGERLGFTRVDHYARLYGLGEKAGWDIPGEEAGLVPEAPPKNGGVGMMTSFGEGFSLTPLELAALVSAVANGGNLYYLQYPRSQQEAMHFAPRLKRHLDISEWIPEITPGMMGAVEYGTARRASYDPDAPIFGKTGTCTDSRSPTHLGWFGSFNQIGKRKLVVVVLLTGGRGVSGPIASGIGGQVYKNLEKSNYFGIGTATPIALLSTQNCCAANGTK
jgi:penicillin-binding protein 2